MLFHEFPVCCQNAVQQHYFGVALCNNPSELSNHRNALDKLGVEGDKLICRTAAGSGAGAGLGAISCGTAFGCCAHPVSAIKVSAQAIAASGLRLCEHIGSFLSRSRVD